MNSFRFSVFQLNPDGTLWCEGSLVPLSPMQRRLLLSFCRHPRQVIAKEVLMLEVWGRQDVPQVSLARTIHGLRRRLSHFQQGTELIRNIYGEGYLFNAGVELLQEQRLADPHPAVIADARSLAMV
jgi:DNA-binding winged helix-turn-helix (wHTH) protein